MPFEARVLAVVIASPGDTLPARDEVERAIGSWNRDRARGQRVVLLPARWETDAVPELCEDAQTVINRQLVDDCDILIAIFHTRLGAPTRRASSGTVEEIEKALARGIPVHVYFSEMPMPHNVDLSEKARLDDFKESLQERGLLGRFVSLEDLSAKVRTALERDVETAAPQAPSGDEPSQTRRAVLRVRYAFDREQHSDSKGRTKMRSRRNRLVLENIGSAPAENVQIEVEPVGDGNAPVLHDNETIERLLPRSSAEIMVMVYAGVASQWRVKMRWTEGETAFEETQSVTT